MNNFYLIPHSVESLDLQRGVCDGRLERALFDSCVEWAAEFPINDGRSIAERAAHLRSEYMARVTRETALRLPALQSRYWNGGPTFYMATG